MYNPCVEGHKHTDSAVASDSNPTTVWHCLSCEQEFANFQALLEASK